MSTKKTIILTNEDDHVYYDSSKQFCNNEDVSSELIFEFNKKNITEYTNDEDSLIISIDKDSELYRKLKVFFSNKN